MPASSEESSYGVLASEVLNALAWDSVGIANTPKGSVCLDTHLWGLVLVFHLILLLLESAQNAISEDVFTVL